MVKFFTNLSQKTASLAGSPYAFGVAAAFIVVWGASGPLFGFSDTWQLVVNTATTIITFLMVFLIQNSQNRDSAAVEAKLDEIIRATEGARMQLIGIEHLTEEEVEQIRRTIEDECSEGDEADIPALLKQAVQRKRRHEAQRKAKRSGASPSV